ncbi:MAG: hypothetical protein SVN78_08405 [Deferribacterota bacterium]|nr:hypothetical protein [Deferribacterota bacterium]
MNIVEVYLNINNELFNWYYKFTKDDKNIYPPVVVKIGPQFYKLNKFYIDSKKVLFIGEKTFKEALEISVNLRENVNIVELSNILNLAILLNIDLDSCKVIEEMKLKGKRLIDSILKIRDYPEILKDYICEKDISFRYLIMIALYYDSIENILIDFLEKKKPTVYEFKKYVIIFIDYRHYLDINYFDEQKVKDVIYKRNNIYMEFINKFNQLKKDLYPIVVENLDNFESPGMNFKFIARDFDSFYKNVTYLNNSLEKMRLFYSYLKENGIY